MLTAFTRYLSRLSVGRKLLLIYLLDLTAVIYVTGILINENGVVTGQYSNGQTRAAGQIALVNFRNAQGLQPTGGGNWQATFASGEALHGEPGTGNFGALRSGALEDSNVDITAELVNMMTAQRAYQANAQTIKTQDQVLTTLLNMR